MGDLKQSFFAGVFSIFTIGILTLLTYKTELGIFIIACAVWAILQLGGGFN